MRFPWSRRLAARRCGLALAIAWLAAGAMTLAPAARAQGDDLQRARLEAAVAHYEAGRHAQAARAFGRLAEQGVAAAQYNLGVMHLRGELAGADRQRGERWLLRAAEAGFVTAMFALGQALETGEIGRRDLALAHEWYERAAERGSAAAQLAMGTAYYLGRGRPHDAAQAAHWYREAAKAGDLGAMYLLGSMYEAGEGVPADLRLALHWYGLAARGGDEAAPGKVKDLQARLASPAAPASAATARP